MQRLNTVIYQMGHGSNLLIEGMNFCSWYLQAYGTSALFVQSIISPIHLEPLLFVNKL